MKTFRTFIQESQAKQKKAPVFHTVFGTHAVPYHDRTVKEDTENPTSFGPESHNSLDHHRALKDHYAHDEARARHIRKYTSDSTYLNKSLITKHQKPDDAWHAAEHDAEHGEHVKGLDKALSAHKTPSHMHVYSGTGFNPERFKPEGHNGKDHFRVHMPAYSSTSVDPHRAAEFAQRDFKDHSSNHSEHKHMLHIEVPKGSSGSYIGHHSHHTKEREFLLPRGSNLDIHPHPKIIQHEGKSVALWSAKLHQDKE